MKTTWKLLLCIAFISLTGSNGDGEWAAYTVQAGAVKNVLFCTPLATLLDDFQMTTLFIIFNNTIAFFRKHKVLYVHSLCSPYNNPIR